MRNQYNQFFKGTIASKYSNFRLGFIYSIKRQDTCVLNFLSIYSSRYLFLQVFTYQSIYLSIYLSIYITYYLYRYLSEYFPTFLSIYLPILLSPHLSIYLPMYLSIQLSLSFHLFINASLYLKRMLVEGGDEKQDPVVHVEGSRKVLLAPQLLLLLPFLVSVYMFLKQGCIRSTSIFRFNSVI